MMIYAMWDDLAKELDHWAAQGQVATFWWRDDDAQHPTAQLDRLLAVADGTPLCLAVIPAMADEELAEYLRPYPSVTVLQHGWRHVNRTPAAVTASEYPPHRPVPAVATEVAAGRVILNGFFGSAALPVFVPPWHGFAADFVPLLADQNIRWLSQKDGISLCPPGAAIRHVNVQVVLMDWSAGRFGDEAPYLAAMVGHLRARRTGGRPVDQPTGLLTHHLVQDEQSYDFMSRLLEFTGRHLAARWLNGGEVFADG